MRWERSLLFSFGLLLPSLAFGQPSPPTSSGPMTVERMHSGFYTAGDVKITEIDRHTSALVGGQAGWVFDDALFVGGGGYWLANGSHDREMAYGGLVVQWMMHPKDRVAFGAKSLVGGGQATLSQSLPIRITDFDLRSLTSGRISGPLNDLLRTSVSNRTTSIRFQEYFFVAEPEATVSLRLVNHLRLTGGVGYRIIASEGRGEDRLRGATGSLGFQIS